MSLIQRKEAGSSIFHMRDFIASTGRPYLVKPFETRDVTDVIEKVLAGNDG